MPRNIAPCVYIMASGRNGTLYLGVTSNLLARIHQHREGTFEGFSKQYGTTTLVWFEQHATMEHAITREKRLKKWNRAWKLRVIEEGNPQWHDLAVGLGFEPRTQHHFPTPQHPALTSHRLFHIVGTQHAKARPLQNALPPAPRMYLVN